MNFRIKQTVALSASLVLSNLATAQDLTVGLTTGLTGTNIEISSPINDYVSVRADMHLAGSVDKTLTLENNSYNISFTPDTKSLLVDVHPFSGAFYMTGGLVDQNINFALKGNSSAGNYTFNDTSYSTGSVGTFTGTAGFSKSIAPYIGMGWSNRNKEADGVAFSIEFGVIDVGTGKADLSVSCGSALTSSQCVTLQNDVTSEINKVNSNLDKKLFYPVAKVGISYRF